MGLKMFLTEGNLVMVASERKSVLSQNDLMNCWYNEKIFGRCHEQENDVRTISKTPSANRCQNTRSITEQLCQTLSWNTVVNVELMVMTNYRSANLWNRTLGCETTVTVQSTEGSETSVGPGTIFTHQLIVASYVIVTVLSTVRWRWLLQSSLF